MYRFLAFSLICLACIEGVVGCGTHAEIPSGMRATPSLSSQTLNTMTARRQATIERNKDK